MNSWRAAGLSYVRYAEACAQAVRNVLKDELKANASRRAENSVRFSKWEGGKPSESKFVNEQKQASA